MKTLLLTTLFFLITSIAVADYTIRSAYKFENIDMIKNSDGSNIMNTTATGINAYSTGDTVIIKCLVNLKNSILTGSCQGSDKDGDIEYTTVERDVSKGNKGIMRRVGGTGKYENKSSTCEYVVELTDFSVGVGYLTASCKE